MSAAVAIRCQALSKRYGTQLAVAGIDLEIPAGECFGLLGPNGAGKTTTVEMLEGLTAPTAGSIELFGLRWGSGHDRELKERFGVQLQDNQLADKLTVTEVLVLFRSFYRRGKTAAELLALLDLEAVKDSGRALSPSTASIRCSSARRWPVCWPPTSRSARSGGWIPCRSRTCRCRSAAPATSTSCCRG